jgi:autotransporter translocation and assembly factor TamB
MWVKTTRITLLVALLVATAVLAYLAANPHLYAGQIGKMISRNLLQDSGLTLSFRTFEGNPLRDVRFLDVTLVGRGGNLGFAYVSCDTVQVSYDPRALLAGEIHVSRLVASSPRLVLRRDAAAGHQPANHETKLLALPTLWDRRLHVEHLELRNASATVTSSSGLPQEQIARVHVVGGARLEAGTLRVDLARLQGRWGSRHVAVQEARGRVEWRQDGIHIDGAHVVLDSTVADVDGVVGQGTLDLRVKGQPVVLTEAFRLLSLGAVPRALLRGEAHIIKADSHSDSVRIQALADGQIATYPFQRVRFNATVHATGMVVHRAQGTFLGAEVDGSGDVGFKTSVLSIRTHIRQADLAQPWTGKDLHWPSSDLAGRLSLTVHLIPPVAVDLRVDHAAGSVMQLPIDSLQVALHFDDRHGLDLHRARAVCLQTALVAEGTVDSANTVAILVRARADDLGPWQRRYHLPVSGTGLEIAGTLDGPAASPGLHVGASLRTLDAFGFSAWGAQAVVELARFDSADTLRANLVSPRLQYRGRRMGSLEFDVRRAAPLTEIPELRLAMGDTTLSASGRIAQGQDGQIQVALAALQFGLGKELWSLSRPATATIAGSAIQVDAVDVVSSTGHVMLSGGVDAQDRLSLRLELDDGELALLPRLGLGPHDLRGTITGLVELSGTRAQPGFTARVEVKDATVAQRQFDRVRAELTSAGSTLTADSLAVESQHGQLRVDGTVEMGATTWLRTLAFEGSRWRELLAPARLDLHVAAEQINPLYWSRPDRPDTSLGWLSTDLRAQGTARSPRVHGEVTVMNLHSGLLIVPAVTGQVEADSAGVRINSGNLLAPQEWLNFSGRLPLRISALAAPVWRPEDGIQLSVRTAENAPLDPLVNIWPHFTLIGGTGNLSFDASGDPRAPTLEGELHIRNGSVQLERTLEKLREIEIDAHFKDNVLRIERVAAREGLKGELHAQGELRFKGLVPDDIALDIQADRFQFISVPRLLALLRSNDLKLRLVRPVPGSPRAPKITGRVEVIQAEYTGEFTESGGQSGGAIVETDLPDWLADLDVTTAGLVVINNRAFDVRVEGDVKFTRDEGGLGLAGVVDVPSGRVPIFNNDFTITSGHLTFNSLERLVPQVDITAVTNLPVYGDQRELDRRLEKVTVQMTGSLDEPKVSFSSESGYDRETIVRMLAGFSNEAGPQRTAIADVALAGALNQLERRLANDIGLIDTFDIDTEGGRVRTAGSGPSIAVGKYISPNFYLKYGQGFSVSERDVFLEYQINRHLLFTTEFSRRLRETTAETQYNFNVNYRVEY